LQLSGAASDSPPDELSALPSELRTRQREQEELANAAIAAAFLAK
jgi:hypothetical protein